MLLALTVRISLIILQSSFRFYDRGFSVVLTIIMPATKCSWNLSESLARFINFPLICAGVG